MVHPGYAGLGSRRGVGRRQRAPTTSVVRRSSAPPPPFSALRSSLGIGSTLRCKRLGLIDTAQTVGIAAGPLAAVDFITRDPHDTPRLASFGRFAISPPNDDWTRNHRGLDHRLRARAIVLALRPDISSDQAADELVAMAGPSPAAPIAVRRALSRLRFANSLRPNRLTAAAVEALDLADARLPPAVLGELGSAR